ncbi:MAG: hypothetical protein ACT6FD_06350 [Methanosarcinaceae archaeon]
MDFAYTKQRPPDNRIGGGLWNMPFSSEKGVKTPENEEDYSTIKNRTIG